MHLPLSASCTVGTIVHQPDGISEWICSHLFFFLYDYDQIKFLMCLNWYQYKIKYWTGYELILKPVKPSQHQVKTIFCSHLIHINIYTGRKYLSSKTDCVRKHNYCTWSANSASKTCRNRRVWITTGKYI